MNQGINPGLTDVPAAPVQGGMLVVDLSGPWTVPVPDFDVEICGGGAGGEIATGGQSGGYVRKRFTGVTPGTIATILLGTNGNGRGPSSVGGAATSGGLSTFILPGFAPLVAGGGVAATNSGGAATGGDVNIPGQSGSPSFIVSGADSNGSIGGSNPMGFGGNGLSRDGNGAGSGGAGPAVTSGTYPAAGNGKPGRAIIRWEANP